MIHLLGIRHHGPGSARSVLRALQTLQPDCILVEGPPDAVEVLPLIARADMQPPVALLVYAPDTPNRAAFFPFAKFSPEWQALRFGVQNNVVVRFFDLPQTHQLALHNPPTPDVDETVAPASDLLIPPPAPPPAIDPITQLARAAAGDDYANGEHWWEHWVEQRQNSVEVFQAITEAMQAVRETQPTPPPLHPFDDPRLEAAREAHMRQMMRAAQREGFKNIAVVCGAWHTPALLDLSTAKADAELLKSLPKIKVQATWSAWTHGRLTFASGYGAGITAPGWYAHVWQHGQRPPQEVVLQWLTRVAMLLRSEGIETSSAHIIEATRLAETLAALRGRSLPDLTELNEATLAVICNGNPLLLQLIAQKLSVGERMGHVPDDAPTVPLLQNVQHEQKRLRLTVEAAPQTLDLDLRKPLDLERSHFFHRLNVLGVGWAKGRQGGGKGTFREVWALQWQPEFNVAVIEASVWGNTVVDAANAFAKAKADGQANSGFMSAGSGPSVPPPLAALTQLLDVVLLADLPDAIGHIMLRVRAQAAIASDVTHLMTALPPLANIMRYGNVRGSDVTMVGEVVDGFVARICIGLPNACSGLNDDAAREMLASMITCNSAITLIQNENHSAAWQPCLHKLATQHSLHGLLAGRSVRILHDQNAIAADDTARRFGLALSSASDAAQAAAWVEGLLAGSGQLLLHDEALWRVIDQWLSDISTAMFTQVLPLVRRTFSTFAAAERRNMAAQVQQDRVWIGPAAAAPPIFDMARAAAALPVLRHIFGV